MSSLLINLTGRSPHQRIKLTGHNPPFRAGILRAEHDSRCDPLRLLYRRAARDDKPEGLPEPTLKLGAHRGGDRDARVERNDLYRHIGISLLWPPSARRVRPWYIRQGIRSVWLAQKRLGEREEGEVLADPAGRESVSLSKGEAGTGVRWVEEL